MSVLLLQVTTGRPVSYLDSNFEQPGGKQQIGQRIVDYIQRVITGNELADTSIPIAPRISIQVQDNQTAASGYFTFTSVIATNNFSINGVTFTAVASGATGNQFNVGVNDLATATNAASAINGSASGLISGYVFASAVTVAGPAIHLVITSAAPGLIGNTQTIASASGTIVASGARLTGGLEDPDSQVLSF